MKSHVFAYRSAVMMFAVWLAAGPPQRASAEDATAALTLEAVRQEALRRNPSLAAAKARWEAARFRIPQAWALPDPSAGYMIMGEHLETRLGPQEDVFEVEQMVPFPGKLWEKRRMAKAAAAALRAAYAAVERDVQRDAAAVYYELYATDQSIDTVEDILEALRKLEQIAQARYATQGEAQRDVAKTQAEVSTALERLFLLRQQRDSLAARLNALLDHPDGAPVGRLAEPMRPVLSHTLEDLLAFADASRPELQEADSMLQRNRHANALAKLEYIPDVSVGFQYVRIGGGSTTHPDDGRDAWMIPLKINLPIWQNRLVPAVREARRNLAASQASLSEERNLAVYDVKDRYFRYTAATKIVELYENALIPEAELAFRSDQAGYEAGRQDALNLLDSERVYLSAKVAYYQNLAEALKHFAELERAVGRPLAAQD